MKIKAQKQIIESILINLQPFLEKKDTSQVTSHVYLNASDSNLTLKATDYEIGFLVTTDNLLIEENGSITANGKKFLDIVRILKDGDIITIDVDEHILSVDLSDQELQIRKDNFVEYKKEIKSKWLKRYRILVSNAATGAVLKTEL